MGETITRGQFVALRKESVDRNFADVVSVQHGCVALRKESVDRNDTEVGIPNTNTSVALRKESVDRNYSHAGKLFNLFKSLSARRAWIEMRAVCSAVIACCSRSPQGERG